MKGGGRLYGRGLNCIHVTGQLCADLTKSKEAGIQYLCNRIVLVSHGR